MFASLSPHSARSQYISNFQKYTVVQFICLPLSLPTPCQITALGLHKYVALCLSKFHCYIHTNTLCLAGHTTTTDLCLNILENILFNRLERNWVEVCLKSVDAVYQPGLRQALVNLSSFTCKEIPKYCENKSELVSKLRKLNSIFRKSKHAVFQRPSCDKRRILVELVQSKAQALPIWENCSHMRSCQEIQVSAGKEIRSEWAKKSIFRLWANPWSGSKYKGEGGRNWWECWRARPSLEIVLVCSRSPVLQVSAVPISAAESIFVRAKIEIVEFQILNGQKQSFCELGIVQLVPRWTKHSKGIKINLENLKEKTVLQKNIQEESLSEGRGWWSWS